MYSGIKGWGSGTATIPNFFLAGVSLLFIHGADLNILSNSFVTDFRGGAAKYLPFYRWREA